jgi:hypothetical protein
MINKFRKGKLAGPKKYHFGGAGITGCDFRIS